MNPLNSTTVEKPAYPVKIMQFGEGNFLRAFVDWMIDKANNDGILNHGIALVQPIGGGAFIKELFEKQDCLYHVYLEGIKDKQPVKDISLIKSVTGIIDPNTEYKKYEELFLSEELEIVFSNTTEAGIRYEEGDDLNAQPPKSFPAKVTALLHQRFKKFNGDAVKGLLIVCCELIEDNGSTLKQYVIKHAQANNLGEDFINWVNTANHFYDTLVDRIVPGFPKETINEIKEEIGFDDNLVVKGEYFHVWAIGGDSIIREKLPLDKAGLNVLFMDDIRPFRAKKVRVLNGAHTAMVPVALQLGCETVMDAFNTPEVEQFINNLVNDEVLPAIDEDPEELKAFAAKILERFYNPYLKHYLKDISLNSLSKWETRDFPTVLDNVQKLNKKARLTTFSFAALLVLYSGQSSITFTPNDTKEFVEFIQSTFHREDIKGWVNGIVTNKTIWKEDLEAATGFAEEVAISVEAILSKGMKAALTNLLK
ncbi:MAG TPA: tagaturonate reductase [Niabella sp.]|nr:tagaturonate reductase [Niabella sp.]HOZ97753.1 tagaturonate reductase [Niabella sp.]HQW14068.1 tagaturonate reductase [Niabella sp.]HQX19389.1 tagaturonate reductase [Niabella sp.]HQX40258.1 tagaturonate reductase [Niabella sp.]